MVNLVLPGLLITYLFKSAGSVVAIRSAVELTVDVQSPLASLVVAELSPLSFDATEDTEREDGISLHGGWGVNTFNKDIWSLWGKNIK